MTVILRAITKPEDDELNVNEFLAYVARVSNPENQYNLESAPRLISYLIRNKHFSPFEMVNVVMEIETTRDIARQILRHRSFSFQEFSQRYAKATNFITDREARLQDNKNRQNSISVEDAELQRWFEIAQESVIKSAQDVYEGALKRGIAKEQARSVLPEGLTMSRLYMNGTLRSWIHYCQLRMGNGTQKEHKEIATQCWEILVGKFPVLGQINWEQ